MRFTIDEIDAICEALAFRIAGEMEDTQQPLKIYKSALRAMQQQRVELRIRCGWEIADTSIECPHCHWGFHPTVITQHIREKHSVEPTGFRLDSPEYLAWKNA